MFRTMLVEDSHSFRQVVRFYLQSEFPSMSIIEAADGVEALKEIDSCPPNLIFTPPPPNPPPPPPVRGSWGRASFTVKVRPPISAPLRAVMAACASASEDISTKPKPRD